MAYGRGIKTIHSNFYSSTNSVGSRAVPVRGEEQTANEEPFINKGEIWERGRSRRGGVLRNIRRRSSCPAENKQAALMVRPLDEPDFAIAEVRKQ
jgi:hypothetical protein